MPIRIGLIGLSDYAQNAHIRNLLALRDRARITALWNRGGARRDQALELFATPAPGERSAAIPAVPALCDTWQQLLGRADVDAVIVTLPPDLNREIVTAALTAGKHVLVEKPLAHSVEDAKALAAAAKKFPKLVVQVGLEVRHGWTHQTLQRSLREGRIGKTALIWVTCVGGADWAYRPGWVTDPVRTGGVFNVWGVHVLDLICELAGSPPQQIFAQGGTWCRTDTPYPDGAQILIDFGAVKANLVYCRFAQSFKRDWAEVTVAGDQGRLEGWVAKREVLYTPVEGAAPPALKGEPFESFCFDGCRQQLIDFCAAIEKRHAPLVTVLDGLRATQLALAIEKSLQTNKPVKL